MFKLGDAIAIPCEVKPGPFSEERLISFDAVDGPVTGFVSSDELAQKGANQWYIRAQVLKLEGDVVEVMVRGHRTRLAFIA